MKASMGCGSIFGGSRMDTEKRQAQVLDFFLYVIKELGFFEEQTESQILYYLEESLYPPQQTSGLYNGVQQISSIRKQQ
jgi:hypothetical protein